MIAELCKLWRGELAFARAFWGYLVLTGLAVNGASSAAGLLIYALTKSVGWMLFLHFLPTAYNAFACIGAVRSAKARIADASMRKGAIAASLLAFALLLLV
ncbi:MAG: hypothetical protein LCH46_08310 [Proteobacteria bacterium]|nr:hypothetical protein [Pseudomonadota bacterium]